MRLLLLTLLTVIVLALPARTHAVASPNAQAGPFVVLDAIGSISLDVQFSIFGSGGLQISHAQHVGPEFTLMQPTRISEFGAFVNNCLAVVMGEPLCPETHPFAVEIRSSFNGVPNVAGVVASFELTHDDDPLYASYEHATPQIVLPAGSYFALITARTGESGYLLGSAAVPFEYLSGTANMGVLIPSSGVSFTTEQYGAVRIIGEPVSVTEQIALLHLAVGELNLPGSGLAAKLVAAQGQLEEGRLGPACALLAAFTRELLARDGRSLPAALAAELRASVSAIEGALACRVVR